MAVGSSTQFCWNCAYWIYDRDEDINTCCKNAPWPISNYWGPQGEEHKVFWPATDAWDWCAAYLIASSSAGVVPPSTWGSSTWP